jgi:DNA-binding ferritin-like protein
MMTYDEAKNLKSFKNYCNCGGAHWNMNGRNPARPHMSWCPQIEEYNEWYDLVGEEFFSNLDKKETKSKLGYSRIGLNNI